MGQRWLLNLVLLGMVLLSGLGATPEQQAWDDASQGPLVRFMPCCFITVGILIAGAIAASVIVFYLKVRKK